MKQDFEIMIMVIVVAPVAHSLIALIALDIECPPGGWGDCPGKLIM